MTLLVYTRQAMCLSWNTVSPSRKHRCHGNPPILFSLRRCYPRRNSQQRIKICQFFHENAKMGPHETIVQLKNISWKQKVHYRVQKSPPHFLVLNQSNLTYNSPFHHWNTHFNIPPSTPRSYRWSLSLSFPHHDLLCISPVPVNALREIIATFFWESWEKHKIYVYGNYQNKRWLLS